MKMRPLVVFETPDDTGNGAPPAAPAVVPPPPAAPPQPPAGAGPWAADLAAMFPDESTRTQVDTFLRSKVQPHVTQIETQYAPARQLYDGLNDPEQSVITYLAATEQLYGAEVAQKVAESLGLTDEPAAPEGQPPSAQPQLTPEQQRAIDWAQAQEAEQLYQSELSRVKAVDPNVQDELFAPFVVGAEGDFDQALRSYQAWHNAAHPQPPAADPPPPPATLTDQGAPAAAPPVAEKFTLDDALDSALADLRAARAAPTTVGSV